MSAAHDPTLVGAYLLGTLDPAERSAVEAHLDGCAECRAELSDLEHLPQLLDRLDPSDLQQLPEAGDDLFDRVVSAIDEDTVTRRRQQRRRLVLAGAAAAVLAAGGTIGGVLAATGGGSSARTFTAASGPVHLTVGLSPEQAGTALDVRVSGLPDDVHCRLLAVARSGRREVAGSWTASYSGTAHVSGLSTSIRRSQLAEIVLQVRDTGREVTVHTG